MRRIVLLAAVTFCVSSGMDSEAAAAGPLRAMKATVGKALRTTGRALTGRSLSDGYKNSDVTTLRKTVTNDPGLKVNADGDGFNVEGRATRNSTLKLKVKGRFTKVRVKVRKGQDDAAVRDAIVAKFNEKKVGTSFVQR